MTIDWESVAHHYDCDELLKMDGFDEAILGIVQRCGQDPFLIYDIEKVIEINMSMGMDLEEAWDHFGFNQIGGWVGKYTPGFLEQIHPDFILDEAE
jgi:hypothetical protein